MRHGDRTAFLFPGQGSQEVGMGRDLFADDRFFLSLVDHASAVTGVDLARLCVRGPERDLLRASYLQPLLVAVSLGYHGRLVEAGVEPDCVVGHSLGEITALAACGIVSAIDAVSIAARRGALMEEAASKVPGGMMAVLFADAERVETEVAGAGLEVVVANVNAPDQAILSGTAEALDEMARRLSESLGSRCKRLRVAGAWHGPFMAGARRAFEEWVEPLPFAAPRVPLILNATGREEHDPGRIKALVAAQLTESVHFATCLAALKERGVRNVLEVGPGRILAGLVRANGFDDHVAVYSVGNVRGVERAALELNLHERTVE